MRQVCDGAGVGVRAGVMCVWCLVSNRLLARLCLLRDWLAAPASSRSESHVCTQRVCTQQPVKAFMKGLEQEKRVLKLCTGLYVLLQWRELWSFHSEWRQCSTVIHAAVALHLSLPYRIAFQHASTTNHTTFTPQLTSHLQNDAAASRLNFQPGLYSPITQLTLHALLLCVSVVQVSAVVEALVCKYVALTHEELEEWSVDPEGYIR